MLYEQTLLRRDGFRLKSANHILVKMSKLLIEPKFNPFEQAASFPFPSLNAPVRSKRGE